MKHIIGLIFLGLAACGPPDGVRQDEVSPHQQPTITTPGIHVSGHVNVGVKRTF